MKSNLLVPLIKNNQCIFYMTNKRNGVLSNFFLSEIKLDGKTWPSTEHYFQAMKFPKDEAKQELIRSQKTPKKAKQIARKVDKASPRREDWDEIKLGVMYKCLLAKFSQHENLKKFILDTEDSELVEFSKKDQFWGDDGSGKGRNELGKQLMKVRSALRE